MHIRSDRVEHQVSPIHGHSARTMDDKMRRAMIARLKAGLPIDIAIDDNRPFCRLEPRGGQVFAIMRGRESAPMDADVAIDKVMAAYNDWFGKIKKRDG